MAKMPVKSPAELLAPGRPLTLSNVADGAEGLVVADLARAVAARANRAGDQRAGDLPRRPAHGGAGARAVVLRARHRACCEFPAWDCLPYDRVSPHAGVVAQRMTTLSRLARVKGRDKPAVLLTTVNAALQRVPARDMVGKQALSAAPGNVLGMEGVVQLARAQRLHPRLDRARARRLRGARRHPRSVSAGHGPCRCGSISSATRWRRSAASIRRRSAPSWTTARARSRAGRRIPAHHRDDPQIPHRLCRGVRRGRPATTCSTRR